MGNVFDLWDFFGRKDQIWRKNIRHKRNYQFQKDPMKSVKKVE